MTKCQDGRFAVFMIRWYIRTAKIKKYHVCSNNRGTLFSQIFQTWVLINREHLW